VLVGSFVGLWVTGGRLVVLCVLVLTVVFVDRSVRSTVARTFQSFFKYFYSWRDFRFYTVTSCGDDESLIQPHAQAASKSSTHCLVPQLPPIDP
jgi:hypothetical protein